MVKALLVSLLLAMQTAGNPVLEKFLEKADGFYAQGKDLSERGFDRLADWYTGQSVAAVASLNNAVRMIYRERTDKAEKDRIMSDLDEFDMAESFAGLFEFANAIEQGVEKFGEAVNDIPGVEIKDNNVYWSEGRRSISLVSPYEDLFMGLIYDYNGDAPMAEYYYLLAYMNPYLDRDIADFSFLATMDTDDLYDLSSELDAREREYRVILKDTGFFLNLPALIHWDASYFHEMARKVLKQSHPDVKAAMKYCEAALRVNPFDPLNYEIYGRLCAQNHKYRALEELTNECLVIDPDNAFFKEIVRIYKKYMEE